MMYTKQEASRLVQEFWFRFGQYMTPVVLEEGEKVNWINYKTGEKDLFFRMQADNKHALVSIEIRHKDPATRQIFFKHFESLKPVFVLHLGNNWTWKMDDQDEHGKSIGRIFTFIASVNIYNKEDWPELISFFKDRMIKLVQFWNEVKYGFELLH